MIIIVWLVCLSAPDQCSLSYFTKFVSDSFLGEGSACVCEPSGPPSCSARERSRMRLLVLSLVFV